MEQGLRSILVADCGTVVTKAVLLDRVEGSYRFVARGEAVTTAETPWHDLVAGVRHAIVQVEEVTGKTFLDESGSLVVPEESGVGVDAFLALVSAAQPLEVVLAGLVGGLSLAAAERAVMGTYSIVTGTLGQDPAVGWLTEEEQVRMIVSRQPEVICVAGGTDGGATTPVLELVEAAALGCSMLEKEERPRILFAGNKLLRERVVKLVGGRADVRPTRNVQPTLALGAEDLEGVRSELEELYRQRKLQQLPGINVIKRWSALPVVPAAKAFSRLVQYLWYLEKAPGRGTLGVDVGAAHTTVAAVFGGRLYLTVQTGLGAAFAGERLLRERDPRFLIRWVPSSMGVDRARGMLINREARPWTVSREPEELWLDQAVVREAIRETLRTACPGWQQDGAQLYPHLTPSLSPILLSGGILAGAPRPAQAALIALDAIEPIGISTLLLDVHRLAPALGGVARLKPLAAVETLDNGGIVNLATVVAPVGTARKGDVILHVRIQYKGGGAFEIEVPYGSLERLPLQPGQEAILELRPRQGFDVGMGGPGKGGRRRVRGGLVGLIIDARGRPLQLPRDPKKRRVQLKRWLRDVGG
jgi:hypothetical protein